MYTNELRRWLAAGKTERVIEALLETARTSTDPDFRHEMTLLSARFEQMSRESRGGRLDFDNEKRERAQINHALLEVIKRLEKERKPVFPRWAKFGSSFVVVIGVLAGLAEVSGFSLRDLFGKKETPAVTIPSGDTQQPNTAPSGTTAPVQTTTQPASQAEKPNRNGSPQAQRKDTTFSIECKTDKGRQNVHYKSGETMRFYVKVSQPCTLRSIYKLADGRLVLLDNDRAVPAEKTGQWLEIGPGFEAAEPFGDERMYVFAQNTAFPALVTQTDADGYIFIKEGLPEALQKTRGFKKKQRFAEASVMLRTHQ